jgi:hypothetical protein
MSKTLEAMTPELQAWIAVQHLFFVATAPLARDGHINCSPKGLDTFRILDPQTVAYLDVTGSGAETIAHVRENGRILFMFCAFAGAPRIIRLHGAGDIVLPGSADWDAIYPSFTAHPSARSIVRATITRISESCGFGVPLFEFKEPRSSLTRWAESKGAEGVHTYQQQKNRRSIDNLPALDS